MTKIVTCTSGSKNLTGAILAESPAKIVALLFTKDGSRRVIAGKKSLFTKLGEAEVQKYQSAIKKASQYLFTVGDKVRATKHRQTTAITGEVVKISADTVRIKTDDGIVTVRHTDKILLA